MSRTQHRDPKKEQFWRKAVAAWQRSGLSVRAFCTSRALAEPSFYRWRRELAHRAQAKSKPPARPNRVPVRVVPKAALEVVLVSGVVVRVPAGAVAQLVAAWKRRHAPTEASRVCIRRSSACAEVLVTAASLADVKTERTLPVFPIIAVFHLTWRRANR